MRGCVLLVAEFHVNPDTGCVAGDGDPHAFHTPEFGLANGRRSGGAVQEGIRDGLGFVNGATG